MHHDHRDHGECRPDLTSVDSDMQRQHMADTYRQLVWHLEVPGLIMLLEAQEGRGRSSPGRHCDPVEADCEYIRCMDHQRRIRRAKDYRRHVTSRSYMVAQLSDPAEYIGTWDASRGSLDELGMAFRSKIKTYQRIRSFILRDAWLIDNDRRSDKEGDASGADSDEGSPDAPPATEQGLRPQESKRQDHGDSSGNGAAAPDSK
jgi:hypothetical protein